MATDHEIGHGPYIRWTFRPKEAPEHIKANWHSTSWMAELIATVIRDGKTIKPTTVWPPAFCVYIPSLNATPEAMLRKAKQRRSMEIWNWNSDTQLREDDHRFRGNGAGVIATLRTAASNLLRIDRYSPIHEGMHSVMDDLKVMLAIAREQPEPITRPNFQSTLDVARRGPTWTSSCGWRSRPRTHAAITASLRAAQRGGRVRGLGRTSCPYET